MRECEDGLCPRCWRKGRRHPATVDFRGKRYCKTCQAYWIRHQVDAAERFLAFPLSLRNVLKRKRFRVRDIAEQIGVTETMVSRYIRVDEPTYPGLETMVALCAALEAHPNELLGFTDPRVAELEARVRTYETICGEMQAAFQKLGWETADKAMTHSGLTKAEYTDFDPEADEEALYDV